MLRLILTIFSIVFLGLKAGAAGNPLLLNDEDREFVLRTLSKVSEELEITAQGFQHCCQAFRNSNPAVDAHLLELMVTDAEEVASIRMSRSFDVVTHLAREEMKKASIKKLDLRRRILNVKSTLKENLQEKDSGGDKKKINLLASSLGFEGDAPGVFLKNLSTYKEDSLELFTGALDEIFQYLSPGSAALRAAPPAEPIVAEDAYLQKPAKKKNKKKNKKKKKGKRKNKGAASSSTSSADVPASEEESEGEDEGEEEKEGAQAGLTERPVVQPDAGGAAAASVEYLGTQLGEMGLPTGRPRVPPAHGEAIPETPVKSTKKPPLPQEERAKPAPQEVQLSSKKEGMLEDTFAAIWRTDPRIDAKGFVTFWESFGFVNTQRAALGNGFFVLQHPQGYKVKTSHAPHNKDEKVFNMALSFAKYLLEAAGITGIRDAAWQAKLKLFLDKPCKGMGR